MISKDYEALRGLLEEFRREAAQLDAQIDDTARKIREAEAFLAVYTDSQPDDIRVFSPRKAEILYKEEIRQKETEKSVYEERRGELSQKRETLEGRMTALQDVLSRQRKNVSSRAEGAKKQYEASMEELGGLAEKILQSSAWIERNPVQARQDLAIIARRLKEAVDRVRDVRG